MCEVKENSNYRKTQKARNPKNSNSINDAIASTSALSIGTKLWSRIQVFRGKFLFEKAYVLQCGNFMIFLSLRFYVKSIFGILDRKSKSTILTHLEAGASKCIGGCV